MSHSCKRHVVIVRQACNIGILPVAHAALAVFDEAAVEGVGLSGRQLLAHRLKRGQRRSGSLLPRAHIRLRSPHKPLRTHRPASHMHKNSIHDGIMSCLPLSSREEQWHL